MKTGWRRYELFLLCIALVLGLTACFRDTSEALERQPVAREYASATAIAPAATVVAPEAVAPIPTAVPPEEIPLIPTAVIVPATQPPPTKAPPPIDEFALSATALIAQLTEAVPGLGAPPQSDVQSTSPPAPAATAVPLVRATVPPGEDCVHEIRAGETLFQLALAYGVTVDQIAAASAIANPDVIAVGQRIIIPLCGSSGFVPPPTSIPSPTIDPATLPPTNEPEEVAVAALPDARDDLVEQAQATLLNNAQRAASGVSAQALSQAVPSGAYTVQEGDTLFLIALRNGTTVDALAALNNITDINSVSTGDILQMP